MLWQTWASTGDNGTVFFTPLEEWFCLSPSCSRSPSLSLSPSLYLFLSLYIRRYIYIHIHRYTATTSSQTADAVHVGQILMLYESMFLTLLSRRKHLFFRCSSDPWQVWPKEQTWIKLLDEALSNSKPPNHAPFCVLQMSITLRVVLIYMHTCIQNFCVPVHISTCIRVCINTYIYTHIYIYIHTYSMMPPPPIQLHHMCQKHLNFGARCTFWMH